LIVTARTRLHGRWVRWGFDLRAAFFTVSTYWSLDKGSILRHSSITSHAGLAVDVLDDE
jgi:hypothetical protein